MVSFASPFSSKRGLLAAIWTIVNILTVIAFVLALTFGIPSDGVDAYYSNHFNNYNNNNNNGEGSQDREGQNMMMDPELAVTSRAMAFSAMWTAVLAVMLSIFGTVILGWQSPTGQYYTCCSSEVHKTTPITLGGFIGALLMFATLALLCAALFGEFIVRDYREGDRGRDDREDEEQQQNQQQNQQGFFAIRRTSLAFSILSLFLALMYGAFAALVFVYSNQVLEELASDEMEDGPETKAVAPGLASPRLSSKSPGAPHFVRPPPPTEVRSSYHNKHSHSGSLSGAVGGYVNPAPPGSVKTAPPPPSTTTLGGGFVKPGPPSVNSAPNPTGGTMA